MSVGMATFIDFTDAVKFEFGILIFEGRTVLMFLSSPTDTVTVVEEIYLDSLSQKNGVCSYKVTFKIKPSSSI